MDRRQSQLAAFLRQRKMEYLELQDVRFRRVFDSDVPKDLWKEALKLAAALPDADFALEPGQDVDELPWHAELKARRAKDGWKAPE